MEYASIVLSAVDLGVAVTVVATPKDTKTHKEASKSSHVTCLALKSPSKKNDVNRRHENISSYDFNLHLYSLLQKLAY